MCLLELISSIVCFVFTLLALSICFLFGHKQCILIMVKLSLHKATDLSRRVFTFTTNKSNKNIITNWKALSKSFHSLMMIFGCDNNLISCFWKIEFFSLISQWKKDFLAHRFFFFVVYFPFESPSFSFKFQL